MEDLGFFNEREAECFEREDTLSQTDLEKLNVPEDMPDLERTEHLLKNGLDKQKLSVLSSLPQILACNNTKSSLNLVLDCIKLIWQKTEGNANSILPLEICKAIAALACATVDGKVLLHPTIAFHAEFTTQLDHWTEEKKQAVFLLSDEQVAKQLIPLALEFVGDVQQKDFAEAISLAVIACLPRLGSGTIKKTQLIRVAMDKGDVSQTPGSRLVCCFLLGAITALNLLSSQDIEGLFLQKMMALCQDTDAEVRKCMCMQIDALARVIGEEKAGTVLLPELFELLLDEEEQVKQTAFLALLSLLDFFPSSERTKRIIPELQNIAESLPAYLLPSFPEQFGVLVTKLAALNHLGNDVASSFLDGYSAMCSHEDDEVRQYCAYNFPAVVKAFGIPYQPVLMDDLLVKLSSDSVERVRVHIAAGLHEVAVLLGPQRSYRYLKSTIIALLKDDCVSVQGMMIIRMPSLMSSTFAISDDDQKSTLLEATIKAMYQYHSSLSPSRNREQLTFVGALQQFPLWCTSDQMYEMVIPILFDLIENGARPVQLLAIQTLVKCIRRNDNITHRFSLLAKLRSEYGHARSYWRRLLYLDACVYALEINSRQYCRLNYVDIAIEMLEDPVPNVRLKAIALVPGWKSILTSVGDDKMLDRIRLVLDECTTDCDRDVADTVHEVKQTLENNDLNDGSRRIQQDEAEDKRRVAEEEVLGLVSDHEDSSADSKWSSMLEYTLVVGKDGQVVRRARVKSLDLANKLSGKQTNGKDTSRSNGSGGSIGGASGSSSNGNAIGMSMSGMSSRIDSNKGKGFTPKTPSKSTGGSITTLPTCNTARPSPTSNLTMTKMPQTLTKVAGSAGKLNATGSKSTVSTNRTGSIVKDTSPLTKIPIIRPTAPAKRESSPSTGTKPSNTILMSATSGGLSSSSVGTNVGNVAMMKSKAGSIETMSSSNFNSALKSKGVTPLTTSKR